MALNKDLELTVKKLEERINELEELVKNLKTSKPSKPSKVIKKKRGRSAYTLFSADERVKIKTESPELKFAEIGKLLGERWGNLSNDLKEQYKEKALKEKEEKEEMSDY